MQAVGRNNDMVQYNCAHNSYPYNQPPGGYLISGDKTKKLDGSFVVRQGDQVQLNCTICGTGSVVGGSTVTKGDNGFGFARVMDSVVGPSGSGVIIQGSPVTFSE
jgi:uncharacterized Zn-binding protein involved in type VI secretion